MEGFNGCFLTKVCGFPYRRVIAIIFAQKSGGLVGFRSSAKAVICGGRGSIELTGKVGDEVLVDFLSAYCGFENIGVSLSWFLCCML